MNGVGRMVRRTRRSVVRTLVENVRMFRSAILGLSSIAMAVGLGSIGATAQGGQAPSQVTFAKDVAPILYRSCIRCHRPDEIAPMSLLTYSDARPWATSIKNRISKREMPPWFLDKNIGIQKYQ